MKLLSIAFFLILHIFTLLACTRNPKPQCCTQIDVQCCCFDRKGNEKIVRGDYNFHFPPIMANILKDKSEFNCYGCVDGFTC
jgi:hypothetical protein